MVVGSFVKAPEAYLDYYMDWTDWVVEGDPIILSTWTVSGGTVLVDTDAILGTFTQIWAGGGAIGEPVELANYVETAEGRKDIRSLGLVIRP